MRKKYVDDQAITTKIDALFSYRKISDLIRLGGLSSNKPLIRHLYNIQTQIYHLDAYLESNWKLDEHKLDQYWQSIMQSLEAIGYSGKQGNKLVAEIRQYERIEKDCRRDKWPTRVPFADFYTTKSCDVRLIRHLVYEAAPALTAHWKENVWKYYDLITEINDDVSDLYEDIDTYNGNRYLVSMLRKGIHKTTKRYAGFIEKVTEKANDFFEKHPRQERDRHLHEWILTRSTETLTLLDDTARNADSARLSKARILEYMT